MSMECDAKYTYKVLLKEQVQYLDINRCISSVDFAVDDTYKSPACCKGNFGMVFFIKHKLLDILEKMWWWDVALYKSIPLVKADQCYFLSFSTMMSFNSMADLNSIKATLLVSKKDVNVLTVQSQTISMDSTREMNSQQPHALHVEPSAALIRLPQPASNIETPADAVQSRMPIVVSDGVTTGSNSVAKDAEQSFHKMESKSAPATRGVRPNKKVVEYRIPGPSNRNSPQIGRSTRKTAEEQAEEKKKEVLASDIWRGLKDAVGWSLKWHGALQDNEHYMTPFSDKPSESIENLEYFHTKSALLAHVESNPCLTYEWRLLWPLLQKRGWDRVSGTGERTFEYVSSEDRKLGITHFRSKFAVVKFIARFPYPLQEDKVLEETLLCHGWKRGRAGMFISAATDSKGSTLEAIRKLLWQDPVVLFANSPEIPREALERAIYLPESVALADDAEPDSPRAQPEQQHISTLAQFVEQREVLDDASRTAFCEFLAADGWKEGLSNFAKPTDWWQYEAIHIAPWCGVGARVNKKPLLGSDSFWALEDVFRYLKMHGTAAPIRTLEPIPLQLDYRSKDWSLNRRIRDIAVSGHAKEHRFYDMLLFSGWKALVPPKGVKSDMQEGKLWVPHWNASFVSVDKIRSFKANHDYFNSEADMLRYIQFHGNARCADASTLPVSSRAESAGSPPKRSAVLSEDGLIEEIVRNYSEALNEGNRELPKFSALWEHLKAKNWRNLSATKGNSLPHINSSVYVPPESAFYKQDADERHRKKTAALDLTRFTQNVDYFSEQEDVWQFLMAGYGLAQPVKAPVGARRRSRGSPAKADACRDSPSPNKRRKPNAISGADLARCVNDDGDDFDVRSDSASDNESTTLHDIDVSSVRKCDSFDWCYMHLLKGATQRDYPVHLGNASAVTKHLNCKLGVREVQCGELVSYYHRVNAWMESTKIASKELKDYQKDWDYFETKEDFLAFVHRQFAVRGHKSLDTAALRRYISAHKDKDDFILQYAPLDVGKISAPPHAIAEHLAEQDFHSP